MCGLTCSPSLLCSFKRTRRSLRNWSDTLSFPVSAKGYLSSARLERLASSTMVIASHIESRRWVTVSRLAVNPGPEFHLFLCNCSSQPAFLLPEASKLFPSLSRIPLVPMRGNFSSWKGFLHHQSITFLPQTLSSSQRSIIEQSLALMSASNTTMAAASPQSSSNITKDAMFLFELFRDSPIPIVVSLPQTSQVITFYAPPLPLSLSFTLFHVLEVQTFI